MKFIEKIFSVYHPWTEWGFWDGFWFVLPMSIVVYAGFIAWRNSKKQKAGGV